MDELNQGSEQSDMLLLVAQLVASQQDLANNFAQLSAAFQAFVSKELGDYEPNYKRKITEYADFNWSDIGARPVSWDSDGLVDAVEWSGYEWIRRCSPNNHKFGNTIRYTRSKKGGGDTPDYLDLIKFTDRVSEKEPLSSVARAMVKKSQNNNGSGQLSSGAVPVKQNPPAEPQHNSRQNVSYPLPQKPGQLSPQVKVSEHQVKEQKLQNLRELIKNLNLSTEKVKEIALERYSVDSSAKMNSEQIENFYQHLKTFYVTDPAPLPTMGG
jgi:hypothetical protein